LLVQLLQEAVREFEGTSEEVSIMVADCEASIAGGDVSGALERLKGVPESSPHYVRACKAMAEIYLMHRMDSSAFIKCYLHLVVKQQTGACERGNAMVLIHVECW
jgi:tetratricopeptide repeat protein 21B